MKQKYQIVKNDAQNEFVIREFAELDKEMLSLLCEETYSGEAITSALAEGKEALMTALRTPNMYPVGAYAEKIAEAVASLSEAAGDQTAELFFNDLDMISKREKESDTVDLADTEEEELDDLLSDDDDDIDVDDDNDNYKDNLAIKKIKSAIKIVDDDQTDIEDDV